ncbi:hybrid sensor histidine kinase/response regulator [Ramlibacter alkalitolerans]|uniref:histidine kinase n=1 Tax=Ramlibacter alkalitolerans TaxID=2039631 RepID=A0ABS1JTW1_9BURK|nr:response regulator [Ramlibacter alkalitolerans]MBL0427571.1 response regulator [Ramlibacter alkalitolerans]
MNAIKRFTRGLARSYRFHHETNSTLLDWIGVVGVVAFSALYLVRLTGKLPPRWDDVWFRIPAIVSCLLLALRRWWPAPVARFYLPYSYATVFYCLAFFMPLSLLENHGAPNTVVNMMIGAVLVVLLTDWRNTLLMIVGGYAGSTAFFLATRPAWEFPLEFLYWWVPLCLVLVAAGSISKYVERRAELERLRRLYSGLAGSIAHEVRNPLAQIQHSMRTAQAMLPRGTGEVVAVPRHQLDAMARELAQGTNAAHRGLQAITLTLQQVNGKSLDSSSFTPLSAATCVHKAVQEYAYESLEQRSRVEVQVVGDFVFQGEETACVLILFNLLKNALYYLPLHPEASITVSVEAQPVHRIVVRDTGPGIAPDRLSELFEEFHSFGKSEGTGLGLAFCRRAMQAFGGDIRCDSQLGRYTEFTLTFPPAPEGAMPAASVLQEVPEAPAVSFGGRTILVVDDSAFNRAIVKARLRELDLRVVEARHGQEALRIIDEGARPAAILMDMEMPGISGIEATRALRERPPPANTIPVLALSANDLPAWREGALAVGMNGYLTKPIQPEILSAELARVLNLDTHRSMHEDQPEPAASH